MRIQEHSLPPESIDRLVDGEVSAMEQRALLARLDEEHDGWRRLALAFVESQSWQQELGGLLEEKEESESVRESAVSKANVARSRHRRTTWLSQAAAIAVAVLLGFVLRGTWPTPSSPAVTTRTNQSGTEPAVDKLEPVMLPVVVGDPANTDSLAQIEIPLLDASQLGPEWWQKQPSTIPEPVKRAFERLGHEVRESRQFYPVQLEDGREAIVPVDEIQVRYVGRRPYQ